MEILTIASAVETKFKCDDSGQLEIHYMSQHDLTNWWVVKGQSHRSRLSFSRWYVVFNDDGDLYVYEVMAMGNRTDAQLVETAKTLHAKQTTGILRRLRDAEILPSFSRRSGRGCLRLQD